MVRCSGTVPHLMTATGVPGLLPAETRPAEISRKRPTPMYRTSVSAALATRAQSTSERPLVGSSWPVTKATLVETLLCVTGMPA